jgi:hypothetical protein
MVRSVKMNPLGFAATMTAASLSSNRTKNFKSFGTGMAIMKRCMGSRQCVIPNPLKRSKGVTLHHPIRSVARECRSNLQTYRVLSDTPCFAAITLVAPTVRFNALAIFLTPCLSRAIDFNNRKSSLVQRRRTTFFFLAISVPFLEPGLYHTLSFVGHSILRGCWLTRFSLGRYNN